MEQSPPGLTEHPQQRGSRLWLYVLVFALALSVFTAISTVQQRQRMNDMVDQLGDTSAAARTQAIDYLFNGTDTEIGRLGDSVRAARRLDAASGSFSDAALAQLFEEVIEPREARWSTLAFRAPLTFYRSVSAAVRLDPLNTEQRREALSRLDMMLQAGNREAGYGLIWDIADQDERDLILETFGTIAESAAQDRDAHIETSGMMTAMSLIGDGAAPIVEPLLDAVSEDLRRDAWFTLAVMDTSGGYTARWREAPEPVAEAMIASSVVLAEDPNATINRFRAEVDEGSRLALALDALAELSRDADGRIDLDADPPQTTPSPEVLSGLYMVRDRARFSAMRIESFRERYPTGG